MLGPFLWRHFPLEELLRRPVLARLPRGPGHSECSGVRLSDGAPHQPHASRHARAGPVPAVSQAPGRDLESGMQGRGCLSGTPGGPLVRRREFRDRPDSWFWHGKCAPAGAHRAALAGIGSARAGRVKNSALSVVASLPRCRGAFGTRVDTASLDLAVTARLALWRVVNSATLPPKTYHELPQEDGRT